EELVHVLVSHPTPPVFDGAEKRNALRNRDEIRFWQLYVDPSSSTAFHDDEGQQGGLPASSRFVILGDLNASAEEGDGLREGIRGLLESPWIQRKLRPVSRGGAEHSPNNPLGETPTAAWRMRADYVLPSVAGWEFVDTGVFWPSKT